MTPLHDHVLLYDKDCPLCALYTGAFIKTGMLDKNGRQDFCAHAASHAALDMHRAKDEIALINTQTGHITYGIDSLLKILTNAFPGFGPIFKNRVFRGTVGHFYAFVSLNRKVIAPATEFEKPGSCIPSFCFAHRIVYIALSWIFTAFVLTGYANLLTPVVPAGSFAREWLICGGQILFQGLVVLIIRKERLMHYLGNMMTVSNIGALLLLPMLLVPPIHLVLPLGWFGVVVLFMLYEHQRRTKILGVPMWATMSWVAYRLLVLALIYVI